MPTGSKGQKRPADVIGNAVRVMRIATGEEDDTVIDDGKDPAAKALGKEARREHDARAARRDCQKGGGKPLEKVLEIHFDLLAEYLANVPFIFGFVCRDLSNAE
jgi:hypothetical protein